VNYLLAVLGLAAACVVWYWVERWAGFEEDAEAGEAGCEECGLRDESCPAPPPVSRIGR
jgi:hypothetical protein